MLCDAYDYRLPNMFLLTSFKPSASRYHKVLVVVPGSRCRCVNQEEKLVEIPATVVDATQVGCRVIQSRLVG